MNNIYHYIGLAVAWLLIAAISIVVLTLLGAGIYRACSWIINKLNIANWIDYHVRRRRIDNDSLSMFYRHAKKNRKYIYLYRLRNIRDATDKQNPYVPLYGFLAILFIIILANFIIENN